MPAPINQGKTPPLSRTLSNVATIPADNPPNHELTATAPKNSRKGAWSPKRGLSHVFNAVASNTANNGMLKRKNAETAIGTGGSFMRGAK